MMKTSTQPIPFSDSQKSKESLALFFDEEHHLTDAGITLYVEALLLKRADELPRELIQHLEECPDCQYEVMDFYKMMEGEAIASPHPYLDKHQPQKSTQTHSIWQWTASLGRVAAVVFLTVFSCLAYLTVISPIRSIESTIVSPFTNHQIDKPKRIFYLTAEKGTTIYLPNGSFIIIPPYCFSSMNGKPVLGKVRLEYRELHQPSDLVASGIGLELKNQVLETVGVFELRCFQEEKLIQIAEGKSISVNMATQVEGDDYENYYLEEKQHHTAFKALPLMSNVYADNLKYEWKSIGKSTYFVQNATYSNRQNVILQKQKEMDSLAILIQHLQENQNLMTTTNTATYTQTINQNQPSEYFKLSLNLAENPTLLQYEDKVWEYVGEDKNQSPMLVNNWIFSEKWDNLTLTPLKYKALSLKGHTAQVNSAFYSEDGSLIITASADHTAKIWTNQAQYLQSLQGHSGSVLSAVFSKNKQYVLTASADRTAKLWTVHGECVATLQGHQDVVKSAIYSPNGQYILTASEDNTLKLWNAKGQYLKTFPYQSTKALPVFSEDSQWIATISSDSSAHIFGVEKKEMVMLRGNFQSILFTPNSQYVLTFPANSFQASHIWATNGKHLKELTDIKDGQGVFSPDGEFLISYSGSGARMWKFNQKNSFSSVLIRNMKNMPSGSGGFRKGHQATISAVCFSKNGKNILTASADHTIKFWNEEGWVTHTLREHYAPVNTIVFSPDGSQMLSASDDHTAKIWIEREVQDVYELELVKDARTIQERNRRFQVDGKRFYTTVKEIQIEEIQEEIIKPHTEYNPLNALLEAYERLLAEKKALVNQPEVKVSPLIFRNFEVKKTGFFTCAKPMLIQTTQKRKIKLENLLSTKPIAIFQISGTSPTGLIKYNYTENQFMELTLNPSTENKVLVLFPYDQVAIFSENEFRETTDINILKIQRLHHINARNDLKVLID